MSPNPTGAPHLRRLVAIEGRRYARLTPAYREHVIPTYRLLVTALGSATDAEAATEKVCFRILLNVTYPAPVRAVAELVAAAAAHAVGDHWRGEYGVEAGTWPELAGGIGAVREGADDLDRLLAPSGIRSSSQLLEWATQHSGVGDLAEGFGISAMHVRELLFYGLLQAAGAGARPLMSAAMVRTDRVIAYVEDLAASRRPRRFRAAREEAFALVAAARIQAAVRGLDASSTSSTCSRRPITATSARNERRSWPRMLAAIVIDLNPNIVALGPATLTWHGVFSVIGNRRGCAARRLAGRPAAPPRSRRRAAAGGGCGQALAVGNQSGRCPDRRDLECAVWMVIGGIVGARLLYVGENYQYFESRWSVGRFTVGIPRDDRPWRRRCRRSRHRARICYRQDQRRHINGEHHAA